MTYKEKVKSIIGGIRKDIRKYKGSKTHSRYVLDRKNDLAIWEEKLRNMGGDN